MANDSGTLTSRPIVDEQSVLREIAARFQKPSLSRAIWQIVNTFGPYLVLWYLMYVTSRNSWWMPLPLAALAGLFVVRIFIIFHDCGHGSFFPSKAANTIMGFVTGMMAFTPYHHWRWEHAVHHASSGNLDARGMGDVWTMTVSEYLAASRWKRLVYRLARNPFILFGIAPLFIFMIWHRFPTASARPRERWGVHLMNLALLLMGLGMSWIFGWKTYIVLQLIVMMVAGGTGLWMFYVQHQFEEAYWETDEHWDHTAAALKGSSFYKLPRILQWFSGNIGFHHIHHLNLHIPNYNLERCHKSSAIFQQVKPITFFTSLKSIRLRLWDEHQQRMVGFSELKHHRTPASA